MLEDAEDESFPSQVCRLHSQIGKGSNPPIICSRKSIELVVGVPWSSYLGWVTDCEVFLWDLQSMIYWFRFPA